MRKIKIPLNKIKRWINNPIGKGLVIHVKCNWPELQLTEEQVFANSVAFVNGDPLPFPDQSIFEIIIE